MSRLAHLTVLSLVLGLAAPGLVRADGDEESCHGTAVRFEKTPADAARKAKDEQKLVFVLHVSGHFEDPSVT